MPVTKLQFRRGTADEWATENPTLSQGEPGFETDTGRVKLGDGAAGWNALGYVGDPVAPMAIEDVLSGTPGAAPRTVSPLVLQTAIIDFIDSHGSNVWMMPVWDGTGTHPLRPDAAEEKFVIWRQPTAPLVGASYSADGDEWEVAGG